ncbi:MAG: fumarate hydratase [Candidatus Omnitrophota bacterium]
MKKIKDAVSSAVGEAYIRALKILPADIKAGLLRAYRGEKGKTPRRILQTIIRNVDIAEENDMFVCQDTGLPVLFVRVGKKFPLSLKEIEKSIRKGVKDITLSYPIRSNSLDTVTRKRTHTNTGKGLPVIHFEQNDADDSVEITFIPKGSGSENMSFLKMFTPADGIEAVKKFVLESVFEAGANPCPPTVVGVGIGGTSDLCMLLAKKAATRNIKERNPEKSIRALEKELLESINSLGIGPMGLGGRSTALAVNIEKADTHITLNPVAVNMQCWAARRSKCVIKKTGKYRIEVE